MAGKEPPDYGDWSNKYSEVSSELGDDLLRIEFIHNAELSRIGQKIIHPLLMGGR